MPEWMNDEDREEAIGLLKRMLTPRQLRKMVEEDIERIVARTEYASLRQRQLHKVRLDDDELAAFLLDLRGAELLEKREIRQELLATLPEDRLTTLSSWRGAAPARSRQGRIEHIVERTWKPGRPWPRYFASFLGFPPVFAGLIGSPDSPAEEVVEARSRLLPLHDYQQDLVGQVHQLLAAASGENRAILSLPTGAGKTRAAVEALLTAWNREGQAKRFILWIAQSEELCEQAAEAFRDVFVERGSEGPHQLLYLYRYWGSHKTLPDILGHGTIVASIQKLTETLQSASGREEVGQLATETFAVVIDEAHHAIAQSYLDFLTVYGIRSHRDVNAHIPLLGLTATPYRGHSVEENRRLAGLFSGRRLIARTLGDSPIPTLRRMGILSHVQHQILQTHITYDLTDDELNRYEKFQQLPDSFLRKVGQDHHRNALLLEQLLGLPTDWPVLFFGCSIEHASAFTALLRRHGRTSVLITGMTRKAARRNYIEAFRRGHLQFLCNYGVLTTGFDAPQIRTIVIARPTTSVVMYEQMIGRGMRGPRNGGTGECLVIDLADNIRRFEGQMAYGRFEEYWVK